MTVARMISCVALASSSLVNAYPPATRSSSCVFRRLRFRLLFFCFRVKPVSSSSVKASSLLESSRSKSPSEVPGDVGTSFSACGDLSSSNSGSWPFGDRRLRGGRLCGRVPLALWGPWIREELRRRRWPESSGASCESMLECCSRRARLRRVVQPESSAVSGIFWWKSDSDGLGVGRGERSGLVGLWWVE
jgi:hypothetical protein